MSELNGPVVPVTLVRPQGPGHDLVVGAIVNLVRIWVVRRALRRFWPDNDLSFRDVMVAVGAIRTLQIGSDYHNWTREPLDWQKNIISAWEKVAGR